MVVLVAVVVVTAVIGFYTKLNFGLNKENEI